LKYPTPSVKHEWYNRLRKTLPRVEPPRTGFEISLAASAESVEMARTVLVRD